MEMYCPVCAEALDSDELHDVAEITRTTYAEVCADFRSRGCVVLEPLCGPQPGCEPATSYRRELISSTYDELGDDMDAASDYLYDMLSLLG